MHYRSDITTAASLNFLALRERKHENHNDSGIHFAQNTLHDKACISENSAVCAYGKIGDCAKLE